MLTKEQESKFLQLAVNQEILSLEKLRIDFSGLDTVKPSNIIYSAKIDLLLKYGLLTESSIQNLLEKLDFLPSLNEAKHSNHYLIEAAPKYRLLKQIGQGGMGTVYQARDTKLNRLVALKFLRDQEQDLVARFLQEARSQARIDHKNICKVYEVGEMEGMPYICMQYINGRSLEQVYKQMNLEEKIKVMKDVSEALHHAHKLGIIHRDIKPANIMVEKREDGNWFPIVMDFGVAREVENRGLTHTGTVVGTPAYMSPEQAQGDNKNIDRRADIYSIGTTLYELIAGHTPFKNDMLVKLIMDIVQKEPESLLQILPNIPTDINLIVMKCLEKEPNNRYQSALALANDLQAYLNGETISVREVSFIKRTLKKAKKHKAIVSLSASAAAILILVVTLFIYIQIRTYQQAQITEEFIGEAEKLEDIMRFSHLMPLHNISQEVAVVNSKLKNIDEKMYRKGSISQGAGNYALGRGYLALQEYSKANDYFDRSRSAGFSSPDLDYAQGKTLGILYELEKEQLEKTIKPQERKEKEQQLNQQFRQPALNYLNSYKSQKNIDTKTTLYIEALIDYYDNNFEQVFKKAHEALIQFPWLYEAHTLVGRAYYKQADAEYKRGEYKSAEELYQKAEQSYLAAISLGQSDPEVYNLIAETFTQRLFLASEEHRRDDSQQFFQNALSFYEKASEIKPDFLEAYLTKSRLLQNYAQNLTYTGTDPTIYLKQSIDAGQKALEISLERKATHRLSSIYNSLSRSYSILSEFEKQDGRPSIETVEKMIENAQKAVDLSPASSMFYANLSASYFLKVEYQDNFGLDITESLNKAIYYSEKAIEMDKDPIFALSNLGFFYFCRAEKELQSGESPIASFKKAEELLNSSISKRPKDYWIYGWLAEVETLKAAWATKQKSSPEPSFRQARENIEKSLELNKDFEETYRQASDLYIAIANWKIDTGQDPSQELNKASEMVTKGLKINPKSSKAIFSKACIDITRIRNIKDCSKRASLANKSLAILDDLSAKNNISKQKVIGKVKELQSLTKCE